MRSVSFIVLCWASPCHLHQHLKVHKEILPELFFSYTISVLPVVKLPIPLNFPFIELFSSNMRTSWLKQEVRVNRWSHRYHYSGGYWKSISPNSTCRIWFHWNYEPLRSLWMSPECFQNTSQSTLLYIRTFSCGNWLPRFRLLVAWEYEWRSSCTLASFYLVYGDSDD